jgi:hypothetical protein
MPTRVVFRCDFCGEAPDPLTQLALERQIRELAFGEYLEVPPSRWLVWLGGGERAIRNGAFSSVPKWGLG